MLGRWIFQKTILGYRILNIIPIRARSLTPSLNPQKVRLFSKSKRNFIYFIIGAGLFFLVLNGYLLLQFGHTAGDLKPFVFALAVLGVAIAQIVGLRAITGDRGRGTALKVNVSLREPRELGSALETPIWV